MTTEFTFTPAKRSARRARIGFAGPSGSGKTYSAILFARGLVGSHGKIAVIDTENKSAVLYSHLTPFHHCPFDPPHTFKRYRAALIAAKNAGFDCVVLDSLSHAWAGQGGILAQKDALGEGFAGWGVVMKEHNALIETIMRCPYHIICTLRVKTEWAVERNEHGKMVPRRVGLAPIQKNGVEYEFDTVIDLDREQLILEGGKDRTGIMSKYEGRRVETHLGDEFALWLEEDFTLDQTECTPPEDETVDPSPAKPPKKPRKPRKKKVSKPTEEKPATSDPVTPGASEKTAEKIAKVADATLAMVGAVIAAPTLPPSEPAIPPLSLDTSPLACRSKVALIEEHGASFGMSPPDLWASLKRKGLAIGERLLSDANANVVIAKFEAATAGATT